MKSQMRNRRTIPNRMHLHCLVALAVISRAAAQSGNVYIAEIGAGDQALAEGNPAAAIPHFERAVAAKANVPEPHIRLAYALIRNNNIAVKEPAELHRAKEEEEKALVLSPENPDALAGLAEITYVLGKPSGPGNLFVPSTGRNEAVQLLHRALEADPNNYAALYGLTNIESSEIYRQIWEALLQAPPGTRGQRRQFSPEQKQQLRGKLSEPIRQAIDHANKAVSVRPKADEAMHQIAALHMVLASIAAIPSEEQAEIAARNEWESRSQLAAAKTRREAASAAELAHWTAPANFADAIRQGREQLAQFKYESALRSFEKAVEFQPDNSEAHVQLATALLRTGEGANSKYPLDRERVNRSIAEYKWVLKRSPDEASAMAGLGRAALALDGAKFPSTSDSRYTAALGWARKATAARPDSFEANALLAHVAAQYCGTASFTAESNAFQRHLQPGTLAPDQLEFLRNQYGAVLNEGLHAGETALKQNPGAYLTMEDLSMLYNVRADWYPESKQRDRGQAANWQTKARLLAPSNDPSGETLRVPIVVPLPPPPPPLSIAR